MEKRKSKLLILYETIMLSDKLSKGNFLLNFLMSQKCVMKYTKIDKFIFFAIYFILFLRKSFKKSSPIISLEKISIQDEHKTSWMIIFLISYDFSFLVWERKEKRIWFFELIETIIFDRYELWIFQPSHFYYNTALVSILKKWFFIN